MKKIIFLTVFILFTLIGCNKQQAENVKLQWSEKSPNEMSWDEAKQYCENLDEGGHNDWRLPNIDELRTLIKNHSGTQSGGSCPISEKAEKLSFSRDWTEDCRGRNGSNVSELGDTAFWFWSSSVESENSINRWVVKYDGSVESIYEGRDDYSDLPYVRCVRNPYNSNSKGSYTKSAAKNHTDKIESDSTSKSENTKNEDLGEEQTNAQPKESTNKQGIKEIGNLQWSEKAPTKMEWYNAINYCKTLDEGGHKDWRLPNIDELKTLIQNCPKTEAGGECKVSAESGCLSSRTCRQTVRSCVCAKKY